MSSAAGTTTVTRSSPNSLRAVRTIKQHGHRWARFEADLKHYSHIRMKAKCTALESIVEKKPVKPTEPEQNHAPVPTVKQQIGVILARRVKGRRIVNR